MKINSRSFDRLGWVLAGSLLLGSGGMLYLVLRDSLAAPVTFEGFDATHAIARAEPDDSLPGWLDDIYRREFLGYEFLLPETVRKSRPRLPYPSKAARDFYRDHPEPESEEWRKLKRDPLLMYVLTGDKDQLDEVLRWIEDPVKPKGRHSKSFYPGRILDWLYDDLTPRQRNALIDLCMAHSEKAFKDTEEDLAPTQTWFLNRMGLRGMECAIAIWGESPEASSGLEKYHRRFFRDMVPLWHVALGSGDGGGLSIPAGRYSHSFQAVLIGGLTLWSSFLGQDLFKQYEPWLSAYGYYPLYMHQPNMAPVPLGDATAGLQDLYLRHVETFADKYNDPYMRWAAYAWRSHAEAAPARPVLTKTVYGDLVEVNPSGKPIVHPSLGLPPERYMGESFGAVSMRSDWSEGATYAIFKIGDIVTNHTHNDSGMFYIYKNGSLAGDTGYLRSGNAVMSFPHYRGYTNLAVAHNVITVTDPEDKFVPNEGGQRAVSSLWTGSPRHLGEYVEQREVFETGDMIAYHPHEQFVYAAGDITAAYQNSLSGKDSRKRPETIEKWHLHRTRRVEQMTRAFLYIRPDYFVIFDRVVLINPQFETRWLLHVPNQPSRDGSTISVTRNELLDNKHVAIIKLKESGKSRSKESRQYQLHGKLHSTTLLPREPRIDILGPPDAIFLSGDMNLDEGGALKSDATRPRDTYAHRVEVSSPVPSKEQLFLHVIQVSDSRENRTMVPVRYHEEDGRVGLTMQANGGTYTILLDSDDGIGGNLKFSRAGTTELNIELSEVLMPNRAPAL